MKRFSSPLVLIALLTALTAPLAYAQSASDSASTPVKGSEAKEEKSEKKMGKWDINKAEKEDLMEVKGIDAATADKIIAGRPYKSKAELKSKGIVDAKTYKMIASHLTVAKAKKAPKTKG